MVTPGVVSTGPATAAPAGSSPRRPLWVASPSRATARPLSAHASAASTPALPAFDTIATRRPAGSGWQPSSAAASTSSPRLRVAMMPGLAEQRLLGDQRRRRGRRDATRRPRWPAGDRPPMTVSTGICRAHPARGPGELARAAERLHVQHRHPRHPVLLPPRQQVITRHVVLIAHRRERRHPDTQPRQVLQHRDAHPARLHHQPGHPRPELARREGGVEPAAGHQHAQAVRPHQPHAVPPADGQQVRALGAQARGDHHQGPHPAAAARIRDLGHRGHRAR